MGNENKVTFDQTHIQLFTILICSLISYAKISISKKKKKSAHFLKFLLMNLEHL